MTSVPEAAKPDFLGALSLTRSCELRDLFLLISCLDRKCLLPCSNMFFTCMKKFSNRVYKPFLSWKGFSWRWGFIAGVFISGLWCILSNAGFLDVQISLYKCSLRPWMYMWNEWTKLTSLQICWYIFLNLFYVQSQSKHNCIPCSIDSI